MLDFSEVVGRARPSVLHLQPPGSRTADADGGSGFLVSCAAGTTSGASRLMAVTSDHVLGTLGDVVTVITHDDEHTRARIVARASDIDIALLAVDLEHERPAIPLRHEPLPRIGEPVIAMGSPFGFEAAVTAGILSSVDTTHRILSSESVEVRLENLLVTDALIGPGNSGGPLLDQDGSAIGVATGIKIDYSYDPSGFGYAVPSATLRLFLEDVTAIGVWRRGTLCLHTEIRPLRLPEISAAGGQTSGLVVIEVLAHEPTAGELRGGDTLVSIDGSPLDHAGAVLEHLTAERVGARVELGYLRDGQLRRLDAIPASRA